MKWVVIALLMLACTKPALQGSEQVLQSYSKSYSADANQTYYAIRWALAARGYPVGHEDLKNGLLSTAWVPAKAGKIYLNPFDREDNLTRDFGVNGGYCKLEFQVVPEGVETRVTVTTRIRSIVAFLKSTGEEESAVLAQVGNYLRTSDPDVTNLGIK